MKKSSLMLSVVVLAAVGGLALPACAASRGLSVANGVLVKDGRPYRGIGANYFSLFQRLLKNPDDASGFSNLTALAQARVPFVRFMCTGFWPVEQQLYLTNRAAYFARLDRVVRSAETNGIGLIPSLFWHAAMVPDLVGEHMDELGNPRSKTIAFIRSYTAEVVTHYKDSPAIWGWEFGNEYNLGADLPNAAQHRPSVWPGLGTATNRTERDELKFAQLRVAYGAFAETVRRCDRTRVLISGNAVPRSSAWHNVHEKKWTADTAEQFDAMLLRDNPDPLDTLCIHLYPEKQGGYAGAAAGYRAAVALAQRCAVQAGKPLFIGEFGVGRDAGPQEKQQAVFAEMLAAIEQERVPLAAFWVFDLPHQDKEWNVTFTNDRAWMLDAIAQANARLKKANP